MVLVVICHVLIHCNKTTTCAPTLKKFLPHKCTEIPNLHIHISFKLKFQPKQTIGRSHLPTRDVSPTNSPHLPKYKDKEDYKEFLIYSLNFIQIQRFPKPGFITLSRSLLSKPRFLFLFFINKHEIY